MTAPWVPVEPLNGAQFARAAAPRDLRLLQVGSAGRRRVRDRALAARRDARRPGTRSCRIAEALARETLAAEREIAAAARAASRARAAARGPSRPAAGRVGGRACRRGAAGPVRLPFHDRGLAHLRGELRRARRAQRGVRPSARDRRALRVGDVRSAIRPARYVEGAGRARGTRGGTVALVHATAYSDDQQMMTFVARRLEAAGVTAHLASPSHLRWRDGRARN